MDVENFETSAAKCAPIFHENTICDFIPRKVLQEQVERQMGERLTCELSTL